MGFTSPLRRYGSSHRQNSTELRGSSAAADNGAAAASNIVAHVIVTWLPLIVFCALVELKEAVIATINKSVSLSSNSLSCHDCLLWLLLQRL
jgi:uncharacterized membrane protein YGL010W